MHSFWILSVPFFLCDLLKKWAFWIIHCSPTLIKWLAKWSFGTTILQVTLFHIHVINSVSSGTTDQVVSRHQNLEMPARGELEWNHCPMLLLPVAIAETNQMTQSEKQSSLQPLACCQGTRKSWWFSHSCSCFYQLADNDCMLVILNLGISLQWNSFLSLSEAHK